ncbi:MAG: hypothetical protein ACLGH0_04040, partial [Thermoanaerobaculia bacterium]
DEIAGILRIPRGTVGKRLHSARTRIRRSLPRDVRAEFMRLQPAPEFLRGVREGLFDAYLGEYRFAERPDLTVRIVREDAELVSYGGGQRSVLVPTREGAFISTAFDGEGRFQRDERGRITQLVYYEFGVRLGVATKIRSLGIGTTVLHQ